MLKSTKHACKTTVPAFLNDACRWDQEFELLVHEPEHQSLTLVLYEHHALDKDDEVGRVSVPISELPVGEMKDMWLDLGPPGEGDQNSLLSLSVSKRCPSLSDSNCNKYSKCMATTARYVWDLTELARWSNTITDERQTEQPRCSLYAPPMVSLVSS